MNHAHVHVIILEENCLLAKGAAILLREQDGLSAIALSPSDRQRTAKIAKLAPHVALISAAESGETLSLVRSLKSEFPRMAIVIMIAGEPTHDIMRYVEAGVSGVIAKDASLDALVGTIKAVAQGKKVLPARMAAQQFARIVEHTVKHEEVDRLTEAVQITRREQDVIDQIAAGRSNREIAEELNIAVHTVKSHVHRILEKLSLDSRLQLAVRVHGQVAEPIQPGPPPQPARGVKDGQPEITR